MRLKPGTIVALEGLDQSGKSTQMEMMRGVLGNEYYCHQPSGDTKVGELVYKLTETRTQLTPLGRQFLHLAAHAEQYEKHIIPALTDRGVVMDRCWWSTVAYGWFGGGLKYLIELIDFIKLCQLPAQGHMPDVVFVFMHAFKQDRNNTLAVVEGYEQLTLEWFPEVMEPVNAIGKTKQEVLDQIMFALARRELLEADD